MRIVVAAMLVLVVAAALWFTMSSSGDVPMPGSDVPPPPHESRSPNVPSEPATSALPAGTSATHAIDPKPERHAAAPGLVETATCHVIVVDHGSRQPVANASLRRVRANEEIGVTDARGVASLVLREPEQLAVVRDGYLLRLVPARFGTSPTEPQRVELVRDEWSPRARFEFRLGQRAFAGTAFVRFRVPDTAKTNTPGPTVSPSGDPFLQRAWSEHGMLAGRPVCADATIELGTFDEGRVHRLVDRQEVRFLLPGAYDCEVATLDGFVARSRVVAAARSGIDPPTVVIELQQGVFVAGSVVDSTTNTPLVGATVVLEGGDPLGLVATTAAAGTFRLGPLSPGALTLHVRHGDHEARAVPVTAPAADVLAALVPLPRTSLRGRVRSRPDLVPIAGANVVWSPVNSAPVTAVTAADGTFVLPATGDAPARLAVQAMGHLVYAELVTPGAPFADYDVLPASLDVRLQKKLTAVFEGVVVDAAGAPVPGIAVRWHPQQRANVEATPGRRVLDGASLQLPLVVTTGSDGTFRIETDAFGPGKLLCKVGGAVDGDRGIDVEARAGIATTDLRLTR